MGLRTPKIGLLVHEMRRRLLAAGHSGAAKVLESTLQDFCEGQPRRSGGSSTEEARYSGAVSILSALDTLRLTRLD